MQMEIILAIAGLLASFFFAGSEAAYTAFNKIRLDIWSRQNKRFIKSALFFQNKPEHFFSTILIGNNFANILYTTFATVWLVHYLNESLTWLIITAVVLFFGEIFPKTLFRSVADFIILQVLSIVRLFFYVFRPLIFMLNVLIDWVLFVFRVKHESVKEYFSRDELRVLLHNGLNTEDQNKYIANVMQLKEVKVREAMHPRTELNAIDEQLGWESAFNALLKSDDPFILLYRETIDNVSGVVFAYEMLHREKKLTEISKPLRFVPENKSCAQLLREFQRDSISLAIVVDEYGGTAGLVTMDDLIEELFGEEAEQGQIKALNQHTWLIDAKLETDHLEELLGLPVNKSESETVAGLVLDKTGTIPEQGALIEFDGFRIEIVRASRKRILQLKIIKNI